MLPENRLRLRSNIRSTGKKANRVPAVVVATHGSKCTVQLVTGGAKIPLLPVIGGPVSVDDEVVVDYSSEHDPVVVAYSPASTTATTAEEANRESGSTEDIGLEESTGASYITTEGGTITPNIDGTDTWRVETNGGVAVWQIHTDGDGCGNPEVVINSGVVITIHGEDWDTDIIGDRQYTEDNHVTDSETFTASIDALDMAIGAIGAGPFVDEAGDTMTGELEITRTITDDVGFEYNLNSVMTVNNSVPRTNATYGVYSKIDMQGSQNNASVQYALRGFVENNNTAAISQARGVSTRVQNVGNGNMTAVYGGRHRIMNDGTGTLGWVYGLRIVIENTGGGAINYGYGVYVDNVPGGTEAYAIYTNSGKIFLQDYVEIDGSQDQIQLLVQGNATQTANIFEIETSGSADLFYIDNDGDTYIKGNVGVGIAPDDNIGLYLLNTWTDLGDVEYGIKMTQTVNSNAGVRTGPYYGNYIQLVVSGSNNITGAMQTTWSEVNVTNTATVSSVRAGTFEIDNQSTGTITSAIGIQAQVRTTGAGSIGTGYALYIPNVTATTPYAIYTNAGRNHFGDAVWIDDVELNLYNYGAYLVGNEGNATSGTMSAYQTLVNDNPPSNSTATFYGFNANVRTNSDAYNHGSLYGGYFITTSRTTATTTALYGMLAIAQNTVAGTVNNMYGGYFRTSISNASGAGTNTFGLYVDYVCNGSPTNSYGLYIDTIDGGSSTNYAIYTAGAGKVRFGDSLHLLGSSGYLSIGTLTQTSYRAINVANITIDTAFSAGAGLFMDVNFAPTGAGHNVYGIITDVSADTTTYNVTGIYGAYLFGLTKTGGGTITSAFGLRVGDVSAGTTNYAIYTGTGLVRFGDSAYIIGDTKALFLGAGSDFKIYYDGTDAILQTDAVAASDLVIDCGSGKTWRLAEPVYDDMRIDLGRVKLGASAPTWTSYKGSEVLAFSTSTDNKVSFNVQIPHTYKEGTDLVVHFHYAIPTSGAGGGAENVKFIFTHSWANVNAAFPAETTVNNTEDVQAISADDHEIFTVATLTGTGKTISSILLCSLERDTSVANDYADDVYLISIDLHFQIDTPGSRTTLAK